MKKIAMMITIMCSCFCARQDLSAQIVWTVCEDLDGNIIACQRGDICIAPCGGSGNCKNQGFSSCVCVQLGGNLQSFVTSTGILRPSVTPSGQVPSPGSTFTFTFTATSLDNMSFILGDFNENFTDIDDLLGGFTGELVLSFHAEDSEFVFGTVDTFYLSFPSYDFLGLTTGENHWEIDPLSPRNVTYHKFEEFSPLEVDTPLVLMVTNDLLSANEPGWITLDIRFDGGAPVGLADVLITEANQAPACDKLILLTGDVDQSGTLTSADIIGLVNYVFKNGDVPQPCAAAGDANCSGTVTSADIIYVVNHVFKSGPSPCDVCTLVDVGSWTCP